MSNRGKYISFYALALAVCILPSVVVILQYFPLWYRRDWGTLMSGIAVSGGAVFLLLLAAAPLRRAVKEKLKTPASWVLWAFGAAIFSAIQNIVDAMIVICFVGFLGNLAGAVLFRVAEKYRKRWEREYERKDIGT